MRENILDKERSQELQIYVVWLNQRVTDKREEIDESILADPRVTQYWDEEGITGRYFAETDLGGLGYSGFVYDAYYVFGPEATWANEPAPLAGSGVPVISEGEQLLATIRAQL
ncbi:MAG: hypothetical protein ABIR67_01110 [Gaiellaceae bacterium]